MSSNRNKAGNMRSDNTRSGDRNEADYVEDAGSNRSGNIRIGNRYRSGNIRIGDRNKNKAGNVKETGKEQDSGHFTDEERSKKLRFLGHEKIF